MMPNKMAGWENKLSSNSNRKDTMIGQPQSEAPMESIHTTANLNIRPSPFKPHLRITQLGAGTYQP
jgi:hypothetical protein